MNIRNNPGNLKGRDQWKGRIGQDERGHVIFDTPEHGFRALMRTLESKWLAGKRAILDIIAAWAPSSDTIGSIKGAQQNDPEQYALTVARWAGVGVMERLPNPADDPELWLRIALAVARYEDGKGCSRGVAWRGCAMWWDDFKH